METNKKPEHEKVEVDIELHGGQDNVRVIVEDGAEIVVREKEGEVDVVVHDGCGDETIVVVKTEGHHGHGDHDHKHHYVDLIVVNENDVKVHATHLTGLQIKEAAIASHVNIQLDFVLAEELEGDTRRIIGNEDVVHLHEGMKFSAVRDDDNS